MTLYQSKKCLPRFPPLSPRSKDSRSFTLEMPLKEDLTEIYDLYEKTVKAYRLISASGARGALKAITEEFYG